MNHPERLSFDQDVDHDWQESIWTKQRTQDAPYYTYMEKFAVCRTCGLRKSKLRMKRHGLWYTGEWGMFYRGKIYFDFEPLCLGSKVSKEIL